MKDPSAIDNLIFIFSKLPGLGPRSARRIILYLLEDKEHRIKLLVDTLNNSLENIKFCNICYNLDSSDPCSICLDEKRDKSSIAIVENIADLWAIERSNSFKGVYHVLGCTLSANSGYKPEDLRLETLIARIKDEDVKEVIVATNSTLDGQTTAFYITEYLKDLEIKISRLASGIPIGGELDYLDEGTLSAALSLRQPF